MKKFLAVLVLLAVAAGLFRNSIYFSLWELKSALEAGDVAAVESRVDLAAFATVPVDLAVASAQESADRATGIVGGTLAGALGDALGGLIKSAATNAAVNELKDRIAKRELTRLVTAFKPSDSWFGEVKGVGTGVVVTVSGTCVDKHPQKDGRMIIPASLGVKFEKIDGPVMGFPASYRAVGIDKESLRAFGAACDITQSP